MISNPIFSPIGPSAGPLPPPLAVMVELPLDGGGNPDPFRSRLEALLEAAEEVQPTAAPAYIFSSEGRDFLKRCNSRETTVTLNLPLSELSSPRIKVLMDYSVFRLTILVAQLPSGGKEKRDFRAELERVILEIRGLQTERKTALPALRLQASGLAQNLRHLPGLVEEAARLGITEVIISPRGTAQSRYLDEALISARRLGVRLSGVPGREETELLPYRSAVGAARPASHSVIASPEGEAIYSRGLNLPIAKMKRLLRRPVRLLAMTGLRRLLPRPSPGQANPDKNFGGPRNDIQNTPGGDRQKDFKAWLKSRFVPEIAPPNFVDPSRLRATGERRRDCLFPWNWTYITEKGEIRPCPASRRVLGDLREKDFSEIWNGSEYRSFRSRLLSPYPLEECRRCSLRGWFNPYQLTDWIWVGMNDRFGIQMGTGWHEREGEAPYRWSRREAKDVSKNSGKKRLALVLHLPGRKLAQRGEVWINGRKAGDFSLRRPGDSLHYFPILTGEGDEFLVTLIMKKEIIPARVLGNNDHRRLGAAFKGAFLSD